MGSEYYYRLYQEKKSLAKMYRDYINELKPIKKAVSIYHTDDVNGINSTLDYESEKYQSSVRHNSIYSNKVDKITEMEQQTPSSDKNLAVVISGIESEVNRLEAKKAQAEADSDYYYGRYQVALEEEREEAARERRKALESFLSGGI